LLFDADVVPLEPAVFCGDRDDRMAAQCAHCPGLHCRPTTWHKTASFTIDCAEETSVTVTVGIVCSVCVLHAGCGTVQFFSCIHWYVWIHYQYLLHSSDCISKPIYFTYCHMVLCDCLLTKVRYVVL